MALKAHDGFDHYAAQADFEARTGALIWDSHVASGGGSITFGLPRVGLVGKSIHYQYLRGILADNDATIIIGCPQFQPTPSSNEKPIGFYDTSTGPTLHQFTVGLAPATGTVNVYDQSNVKVASSPASSFDPTTWQVIEIMANVSAVEGSVTVRVEGENVVTVNNIATQNAAAAATCNQVFFGGGFTVSSGITPSWLNGDVWALDDFYVCDGIAGPGTYPCNNFLGDQVVTTLYAVSNNAVQWSPHAGANWQEISQTAFPGDAAYNETVTPGDTVLFNFGTVDVDLVGVLGVQVTGTYRLTDGHSHTIAQPLNSGGAVVNGATFSLSGAYTWHTDLYVLDPKTNASWTAPAVNSLIAGYELVT